MKETGKYKLLTLLRYMGDGFFYPFFSLYLMSRDITESKIGLLVAMCPLFAILLNPLYTRICKNIRRTEITLGVISIMEGINILIIGLSTNFNVIFIFTILMAVFGSCHYGLMDALISIYADNQNVKYSSIRMYGSLAYIVATAFGGFIVELISYEFVFMISMILFSLSGIFYFILKDIDVEIKQKEKFKFKELLKNFKFMIFLLFYALMSSMITTNNYFFSTYLNSRGVTDKEYGFVFSYCVVIELITLLLLTKIRRQNKKILLIISSICLFLRLFVCYLYAPILVVIILAGLRGVGYGILLHVSYPYIINLLGEKNGTNGVMLASLVHGAFVLTFNNVGGIIIENNGYQLFYFINVIICVIILTLSIFLPIQNKKSV